MHHLGMCMAQAFNQRYDRPGHLFQSRFGSRLISDDRYLLELARYLPLNPVRLDCVTNPRIGPGRATQRRPASRSHPGFSTPAS
jgi:hypothetical protein